MNPVWARRLSAHKYRAIALFLMMSGLLLTANGVWISVSPPTAVTEGVRISPTEGPVKGGQLLDVTGADLGFPSSLNGYIPVRYIQFGRRPGVNSDAFIDTEILFKKTTLVTTTFSLTSTAVQQSVWGATRNSTTAYMLMNPLTSTTMYPSFVLLRDPNNNNRPSTFTLNTKVQKDEIVTLVAGNGRIAVKNAEAAVVGVADEGEPVRLGSHNASFFSGRVYAFVIEVPESYNPATQVTTPRKVQFDGVPAWNPATRTYGMYDRVSQEFFGNSSHNGSMFVGTITGPNGSGAPQKNPDEPPFAVTFTGTNGMGEKVSVPCADPKVVTSGHGTCVVPPSMFGGDGAGVAEVTVTWQGATGATHTVSNLTYTYRPNPPTVTSLVPSVGPMTGGGGCTVTGTHFVTLLDALGLPNQVITTGGPPGSRPAAWTEHDKTVYGWFNPETQALSKYDDVAGAMFGIVSGVETHVPATLLTFGAQAGGDRVNAAGVTVRSGLVLTCDAIPAHAPGPVDVSVTINGVVAGTLVGKYKYTLVGDLEVVKKAWLCPADVSTSNIGPDDCTAILDGGNVTAGTVVTWTYTTTFVAKNALGNRVSIGGHVLTNVTVHDDQIGDVCTHPQMLANKPYVCSAAGPILLR